MIDHDRLIRVWKLELESRKLKQDLKTYEDRIAKRAAAIHQCKLRIVEGQEQIALLTTSIAKWEQEIATIHKRIELVNQSVQMGHLQDADAVEEQLSKFQARVDELETLYLEALEEQERLDFQEGVEHDNILNHQQQTLKITDKLEHLRPPTLDRLDVIASESEDLLQKMNPSVSNRYRLMNQKMEKAVAGVRKESCAACFMKLPTELLWTALHRSTICHCPYCSVFLIPVDLD